MTQRKNVKEDFEKAMFGMVPGAAPFDLARGTLGEQPLKENPEYFIAEVMLEGADGAVERQEARGQKKLCEAAHLSTDMKCSYDGPNDDPKKVLEAWGVKVGEPVSGDEIFTECTLPDGWEIQSTDHSMWNRLVDEMKFANEIPKEIALKELESALNGDIGYCYIGGTLGIGDHGYTIGYIDDPEVELAAAKVYVNSKPETSSFYKRSMAIIAESL